jgi:hypothetical protein
MGIYQTARAIKIPIVMRFCREFKSCRWAIGDACLAISPSGSLARCTRCNACRIKKDNRKNIQTARETGKPDVHFDEIS